MTKKEFLEQINKLKLSAVYGLISFRTESLNSKDSIFFQYFASSRINLKKFIDYNFKFYGIKRISKIDVTQYNCVIAYVEVK